MPPAGRRTAERLRPALLSLALNLVPALAGLHRSAQDAYTHIFLADHYRLSWFTLAEFRWYGGFSAASYPPLVHQLIALLSWPLSAMAARLAPEAGPSRLRGEEAAFAFVLLAVLAALPYAATAFARLFVGPGAARRAGLLAIFWPGVWLAGWSLGQLPALAGTVLFLFALAQGGRYVMQGDRPSLLRSLALAGAAAAAHHGALLFGLFGAAAVVARALLIARQDEPATKARRHKGFVCCAAAASLGGIGAGSGARALGRGVAWLGTAAAAIAIVLWPFLEWSGRYARQAPIGAGGLGSLAADPLGAFTYLWPAFGAALALLPCAALDARRLRRLRPPAALAALFLLLALGTKTPLPRWLFGAPGEWLPAQQPALWAGLCLLPFAGALAARRRRVWRVNGNWWMEIGSWVLVIASALAGGLHATVAQGRAPRADLAGPAEFLAEGANDQWRYVTLGFGAQAARLAVLTTAGSVDGAYPPAREARMLRESGLARLDLALRQEGGAEALRPFLESDTGPEGWSLRWAFVNDRAYAPLLREAGWTFDRAWDDGVELWRRDRVWPVTPRWPAGLRPTPAGRWWGIAPLAGLAAAATLAALDNRRMQAALRAARAILLAGIVLTLPIGWHRLIYLGGSAEVLLTYRGVLVFASDALLACLLAAWLAERWAFPEHRRAAHWGPRLVGAGWLGLTAATGLSLARSADSWLTTAVLGHLALLGGLYLYLLTEPPRWRALALLLAAQLTLQAGLGLWEFGAQSTVPLEPLRLPFVAGFRPEVAGASVVQTADGTRWLRAYGSLWHPNVLGAVLLLCLGGPALLAAFGRAGSQREAGSTPNAAWRARLISIIAAGSYTLGVTVLAVSFSRAAWLGAAAAAGMLLVRLPRAEWRRWWPAAALGAAALAAVVVPYRALFFTRATADARSPLEQHSVNDRASMARVALDLWARRPWTGVGAGAFVQAMAGDPGIRVTREPAHSVPLLVLAETGAPGALALGALAVGVGREMLRRRRRTAPAHVFGALLAGLLVMSLFDHFLWSSAPGRMLAALALGLWAAAEGEAEGKAI